LALGRPAGSRLSDGVATGASSIHEFDYIQSLGIVGVNAYRTRLSRATGAVTVM
jgi:hypothetical protein